MKDRLVTLGLAVGALFMCYALLIPKPHADDRSPPRPTSSEEGPAGYLAAKRWLESEHFPVGVLNDRFDGPHGSLTTANAGNVLITTLPHKLPIHSREASALDAWVEQGNTLVVSAALDDTPSWALDGSGRLIKDVERLSRLKFETVESQRKDAKPMTPASLNAALQALAEPRVFELKPRAKHPLMDGVGSLAATSDLPASVWRAAAMDNSAVLQVAQTDGGEAAIFVRRQGQGQVITIAVAGLFSNRDIGSADNALLLANIIAWSLKHGGSVLFDDMHQGAVTYYDGKKFFADPRLPRALAWFVFLWLLFVLGVRRLAAAAPVRRAPDVTAFVSASGEFFASSISPAAAGNRLLSNFFDSLRRPNAPADAAAAWNRLASQASVSASEVAELKAFQQRIRRGRRFDLKRLQNLVSQLKGKML